MMESQWKRVLMMESIEESANDGVSNDGEHTQN